MITADADHPDGVVVELSAGDLLLTLPGESLQFINDGSETARVLFICAPPYPADDADTRTLDAHGPYRVGEERDAIRRLEAIRTTFNEVVDRRVAALRRR